MKKWLPLLIFILSANTSVAACILRGDNSPVPFPLNLQIFEKYQQNWLLTPGKEISIRFIETKENKYHYFMINNTTEQKSYGTLVRQGNGLCDLQAKNPFCIFSTENESLKMVIEAPNCCLSFDLNVLSFYRL